MRAMEDITFIELDLPLQQLNILLQLIMLTLLMILQFQLFKLLMNIETEHEVLKLHLKHLTVMVLTCKVTGMFVILKIFIRPMVKHDHMQVVRLLILRQEVLNKLFK